MKDFVSTLYGTLSDYCDAYTLTLEDIAIESHYETLKQACDYNSNSSLSKTMSEKDYSRHLVYNSRHDYYLISGSFKEVQNACHVESLQYNSRDTSHKSLMGTFCRINSNRYFDSLKDD